jgi:hypothetical protein
MFQQSCLLKCFQLVLSQLSGAIHDSDTDLLKSLVLASEAILSWNFTVSLETNFDECSISAPELGPEWSADILSARTVELFFALTECLYNDDSVSLKCLSCLSLIAGVHGPVFSNLDQKTTFVGHFIPNLCRILVKIKHSISTDIDHNLFAVMDKVMAAVQIFKQLIAWFPLESLIGTDSFVTILSEFYDLTIFCVHAGVGLAEDTCITDAADEMLLLWSGLGIIILHSRQAKLYAYTRDFQT